MEIFKQVPMCQFENYSLFRYRKTLKGNQSSSLENATLIKNFVRNAEKGPKELKTNGKKKGWDIANEATSRRRWEISRRLRTTRNIRNNIVGDRTMKNRGCSYLTKSCLCLAAVLEAHLERSQWKEPLSSPMTRAIQQNE